MLIFTSCENSIAEKTIENDNAIQVDQLIGEQQADTIASPNQVVRKEEKKPDRNPVINHDWDKKIIKNASINIEVKDYQAYYSAMREKVKSFGGYVAHEEQTESEYDIRNNLTIKVPVDQFDNAVLGLTQNAEKLNEKRISSQDVTSEYVDVKSRMESKKQVRLKYLDLLKQAKNMDEILNVQSEINEIQEEIEAAGGRIEYLSHSSAFSTISLTCYQVLNPSANVDSNPSFGTKLAAAFRNGGNFLVELFVGLVSIWPLILVVFVGIFLYRKNRKPEIKQAA